MQYADALGVLREIGASNRLGDEEVSSAAAVGRRAAQDVLSTMTIPPFDNSGVDGYCFPADRTLKASAEDPLRLSIAGTLFPGDLPPDITPPGFAWEIMTGAPFPFDCDCAVKVEDTEAARNDNGQVISISLKSPIAKGEFVRKAGADFSPGTVIVSKGAKIRAEHLMALAANGIATLKVFRKPRVVLVPTGAELKNVGEELEPGQIYNSTEPYLVAALSALGCSVETMSVVRDDPQAFEGILDSLKKSPPDLLLTTGAVSMGKADFVRPSLEKAGAKVLFHRVEIRPGKPILLAKFDGPKSFIAFGLPGNPVSSVIGVRFFIEPYLRALVGAEPEKPIEAVLENSYKKPEPLRCFLKASFRVKKDQASVQILSGQPSFMINPLLQASSWAVIPEGVAEAGVHTTVHVYPQTSEF
jgi:molybdopterin molybdotransferase